MPVVPGRSAARRALLRATAAGLAAGAASGCGFRLRGATPLPFKTLYLAGGTPLILELKRALRNSGATLVDRAQGADAVLDLMQESREREILAFSSTGRAREYQVRLRVTFRLTDGRGREFLAPSEITLRREIVTNDLQVTTRAEEEALLFRDMQTDMVQQMLRRIGAVRV